MNTPLDLEPSKVIFSLTGWYSTQRHWMEPVNILEPWFLITPKEFACTVCAPVSCEPAVIRRSVPAPTFGETIRVMRIIGSKKDWGDPLLYTWDSTELNRHIYAVTWLYHNAPSDEEGMRAVSNYLLKLLKKV